MEDLQRQMRQLDAVDVTGDLQPLVGVLADLLEHATSPGTRRAYAINQADSSGWNWLTALPAVPTVAMYVT